MGTAKRNIVPVKQHSMRKQAARRWRHCIANYGPPELKTAYHFIELAQRKMREFRGLYLIRY
jgi:hypothetical protein